MVGDIVLFRLDENVLRPMLVLDEREGSCTGTIFIDWDADRSTRWIQDHCFYVGSGSPLRHILVPAAVQGIEIGQWSPKPKPKPQIAPLKKEKP